MSDAETPIVTSDQLPEDPLKMPPPYWRTGGATFHILESLLEILRLLEELEPVHERTILRLDAWTEQHPEEDESDEKLEEFSDITFDLAELETRLHLKTEVVVLMCAIELEDRVNQFCVYNLHKNLSEAIEKLSPAEKIVIAAATIEGKDIKGNAIYDGVCKLVSWRNAFAHGHCTDRPTTSLRHNHLIPPQEYWSLPRSLLVMKKQYRRFEQASRYLRSISVNPYTAGASWELTQMGEMMRDIDRYRFIGDGHFYELEVDVSDEPR